MWFAVLPSFAASDDSDWSTIVQRTTDAVNQPGAASTVGTFGYPPAFDKNPAPDLVYGHPTGNGIPLIYMSHMLGMRRRARQARKRPGRDDAPVEGAMDLDAQLAVGNDWFAQTSVQGMRGDSLKRFAKQQQQPRTDNPPYRLDPPYLQTGAGWAPGDAELSGWYENAQGRVGPYRYGAQPPWHSLERDANTAEAMAAGMSAPAGALERATRPKTPPPQPLPATPQSRQREKETADVKRVLEWRQRMRQPQHVEWIQDHLAEHPLALEQKMERADARGALPRTPVAAGLHHDGRPPDPWEKAPAPPVDLVAEEPRLVRLQREKFMVPTARGEQVDTVLDHQQL